MKFKDDSVQRIIISISSSNAADQPAPSKQYLTSKQAYTMNILSAACFLLLSANASIVSGSGIRGSGSEMEQEKKESSRNLSVSLA